MATRSAAAGQGSALDPERAPGSPPAAGRPARAILARSISVLTVSQVITWTATLVWTVVVPRRLGSSEVGVYTLGQASSGILLVVVGLGLRPLLVREIAAEPSRTSRLVGTAIVLRALFAVPALALTLLLTWLGPFHGEEAIAILLGWGICLFTVISEPIAAGFQAMDKVHYLAFSSILSRLVGTASAIAMVMVGIKATGLLIAAVALSAAVAALTIVWSRPHFEINWRTTGAEMRKLLIKSLPYWSFVAFFTFYLWIDSFMLGAMTSSKVLGWYALPTQLFGTLMFIPTILSTAWLAPLVRASRNGTASLLRLARPAMEAVVILSLPVCAGAIVISAPLVRDLYGQQFVQSVPVFALLALCVPPMYLNIMANQVMIARNQQMVWTKMMGLASVVNPLANLVLIPYFQRTRDNGAIGAAIAMVVTEIILAAIGVFLIRGAFTRSSIGRVLRAAVATLAMAILAELGLRVDLIVSVAVGLISFPLLAMLLRVPSDGEREQVARMITAIGRRLRRPAPASEPRGR